MLMETRQPKGYKYITLYIIFVNPALSGVFMREPNTQSWVCHFFLGKLTLFLCYFCEAAALAPVAIAMQPIQMKYLHSTTMTFMRSLITFYPFFLRFISTGGESSGGRQTRTGVAVCSQRRALLVAGIVLGSLLLTAIIIAYAGPQNGRFAPCPMTHAPSVPCPKGGAILTPLRSFLFTSFSRDFFRPCF